MNKSIRSAQGLSRRHGGTEIYFGAIALLVASALASAGTVSVDPCEDSTLWRSHGAPHGKVTIEAVKSDPKQGEQCVRLGYSWRQAWAFFEPRQAWGDHEALVFWLRFEGRKGYGWKLGISAEAEDEVFTISTSINYDFDGWREIRLRRDDFASRVLDSDKGMDWSKIRAFALGVSGGVPGSGAPAVLIDDVRYEAAPPKVVEPPLPDTIPVNDCDATKGWRSDGVDIDASPGHKTEGRAALRIRYEGVTRGTVSTAVKAKRIGPRHALAMSLRGPGVRTSARLHVELDTRGGGRFVKPVSIVNFEMSEQLLFPGEFHRVPAPDGTMPDWRRITGISFALANDAPNDRGNLVVDDIRFVRTAPPKPRAGGDERNWWWDGGFDPFAAMHVIHADWPHLESDERPAMLKFSAFLLSPLVPYAIYLHNDGSYSGFRVTITDWETDVVDILEVDSPRAGVTRRDLVTPARTGSYIFNVECLDGDGAVTRTYQTGITVLAKRLNEPKGIWGMHGYIGSKGSRWPHHPQVLRMLKTTGVMALRERTPFVMRDAAAQENARQGPQARVLRLARQHGIATVVSAHMPSSRHLWGQGRYDFGGIVPGKEQEVFDTMVSLAETYKGLVDWWEIGNEPNEHPLAPYAGILTTCYRAAKQADPAARVVMGGSHVIDRWQYQAWERERETGVPHQDALSTHLYPEPHVLEEHLRGWITAQGQALIEEGMLMTEGGWPTATARAMAMHRQGLLPEGYSGERVSQDWYMRYAPLILGEHMKVDADLYAVCFFRSTPSMGDWVYNLAPGELRVHSKGHFVARWNGREISMGRPMAYTHNTIARLLTHEVTAAEASIEYDTSQGLVEHYAFARPSEVIVPLWIGIENGKRAERLEVSVTMPPRTGLVLACDMDGNERVIEPEGDVVRIEIELGQPRYVRFIESARDGRVHLRLRNLPADMPYHVVTRADAAPHYEALYRRLAGAGASEGHDARRDRINIYVGTPTDEPNIAHLVSRDRDLPVISDLVPARGAPMVLHSASQRAVFLVGQTVKDAALAVDAWLRSRKSR